MPRTKHPFARSVDMRGQGRVYRRGQVWWYEFWHNGRRYAASSRSTERREAFRLLTAAIAARDEGRLPTTGAASLRVTTVLEQYLVDLEHRGARSLENSLRFHAATLADFFAGYKMEALTASLLDQYVLARKRAGRTIGTINRELRFLRAACRLAWRRHQILRPPQVRLLPGEHVRQGFFEWHEFERVMQCLPAYLQPVCQFAYWTGWRKGEILSLEWRDVDLTAGVIRLRPEQSKTGVGRVLGLNDTLRTLLEGQFPKRVHNDQLIPYVFHRHGLPMRRIDKAWQRACRLAGLPEKLFHDFRRTAVRNMVFAGVPEVVAMQVSGHKTRAIFDRYTIVAPQQTTAALDQAMTHVKNASAKIVPLGRRA